MAFCAWSAVENERGYATGAPWMIAGKNSGAMCGRRENVEYYTGTLTSKFVAPLAWTTASHAASLKALICRWNWTLLYIDSHRALSPASYMRCCTASGIAASLAASSTCAARDGDAGESAGAHDDWCLSRTVDGRRKRAWRAGADFLGR